MASFGVLLLLRDLNGFSVITMAVKEKKDIAQTHLLMGKS